MKKTNSNALCDQFSFREIEKKGFMIYDDGSFGCGFKLVGLNISCSTNDEVNKIALGLQNFLGDVGEEVKLQFFYRFKKNASALIEEHRGISKEADKAHKVLIKSRCEFLEQEQKSGKFFIPEIYFFVRGQGQKFSMRKFWQSNKQFEKLSREEFEKVRTQFLRHRDQVESGLERMGLNPKRLNDENWINLLFDFFNLSRSEILGRPTWDHSPLSDPLLEQCLLTDLQVYPDSVKMGRYHFRVLTLKNLPEGRTWAGMIDQFLNTLPFHFWLSQTISIPKQAREIEKLELARRVAHAFSSGGANVSDLESESKFSQIEGLLEELLEGTERVVSQSLTLIVWGESPSELDGKCDEVLSAFRGMGQAEGLVETVAAYDGLLAAVPGACEEFRAKKLKSSNAAHLMPIYAPWSGHQRPVCLFHGRNGELVKFDVFPEELLAWNSIVFAPTGAGKSFAVLQCMMQFAAQNPRPKIVWIDNGASSKRLLDKSILDGQFIDLNLDSGLRLNMFDLPKGKALPSASKIRLILAVLEEILKDEGRTSLPKRDKALLEECVQTLYQNGRGKTPVLSDLKRALEKHSEKEMRQYAQILFSWTGKSAYGQMLDGPSNVDLNKDLAVIEVGGLDNHQDLQSVMLLIFTDFIRSMASEDSGRPVLLIIDECWKMFKNPCGREFAIEAYRTFRKFGAGIWAISQNYRDFLRDEEIRDSILINTASIFILPQRKIDWNDFADCLQLDEAKLETAKGLKSVKREFTEALLIQQDRATVLSIKADPLSYWIATSDPVDKAKIEEVERKNPKLTKLEVVSKLATENKKEKARGNERHS
ncbi:MAG: TraC family protein [Bacteriovoracales bacterium]|nr:TraC family protein [Bacteriovoracales bacterium]